MSTWPFFRIRLVTPRLELRPADDLVLEALLEVVRSGVHLPEEMPFNRAWTDVAGDVLERQFLQYFWSQRASWRADEWRLPFAVFRDGRAIGVQQLIGVRFPELRSVDTSSWLALSEQGRSIGTEMRAAVLDFAFRGLGAEIARSGAHVTNIASIRVSEKLGYQPNGTGVEFVRGQRVPTVKFALERAAWLEREPVARIDGLAGIEHLFGAEATVPA